MVNVDKLMDRESMGAIMQLTLTRQFAWQPAESMKPIAAVLLVTSVGVTAIPRPAEHFKWHAEPSVSPAIDIAPYPRLQAAALLTQPVIPMTDPFTPGAKPITPGVRFTEPRPPAPLASRPTSTAQSSKIALMPVLAIPHRGQPPMKGTASPTPLIEETSPPAQFVPGGEALTPPLALSASNPLLPPIASQDQADGTKLVAPEIKAPSDFELNVPGTRPRLQPVPMLDPQTRIELAREYADDAGAPVPAPLADQPQPPLGITAPALSDTPAALAQPFQRATSHIKERQAIEGESASRPTSPAPLQVVSREAPRISRIAPSPTPRTISPGPMPDQAKSSGTSHYVRTSQGLTFEVSAQVNGTSIGRLPLLIADGENISVRLADLLAAVAPMMSSHVHDRLSASQAAQDYMTFNDLRAAGISVRFDSSDRLVLGVR
ncbi:MAG TPA: hypothetical protein VGE05_06940 [Novosphingobium sp.]